MPLYSLKICIILCLAFTILSCQGQDNRNDASLQKPLITQYPILVQRPHEQISQVVRMMFQDSKGHIWFGAEGGAWKHIYCLVRAADEQQAKQRIIANFNKRFSWREEFNTRVHMVLGELDQPQLGIKPADYAFLTKTISAIYHNGAAVNFVAPYQTLRATNVNSVTEILKLATDTVLKSVHFISTLGVFNSIDRGQYDSLKETDHLLYPENIFGGYAQTKWVAEAVLCEAKQRGVPVFIYRPGLITGDSNNGYMNTDDFLCRFLKSCIQLKAFPDLNIDIDMTPVNYVIKAVVHLSQQSNAQHRIFHLLCPKPIKLAAFVNLDKNGRLSCRTRSLYAQAE